ncbi:MAG: hypothetical protein FJ039_02185 [Chloroflexi bacterium]|nr:hypothetical protein [Chloroflexota bacterium]
MFGEPRCGMSAELVLVVNYNAVRQWEIDARRYALLAVLPCLDPVVVSMFEHWLAIAGRVKAAIAEELGPEGIARADRAWSEVEDVEHSAWAVRDAIAYRPGTMPRN